MKNREGFTLIELLAVIVVLAIIALITIPQILGMVGSSKKKAAVSSIDNYVDSINKLNAVRMADNEYNFLDYKDVFETGFDDNDLNGVKTKGTKPDYVYFEYDQHKKVVKEGKFCINEVSVDYINGKAVESENDYCNKEIVPGLYDNKNNLVVSWDTLVNDYHLDLDWWNKYPVEYYIEAPSNPANSDDFNQYKFYHYDSNYKRVYVNLEDINDTARPSIIFCKSDFDNVKKLLLPKDIGMVPDKFLENFPREWDIVVSSGTTRIGRWAFAYSNVTSVELGLDVKNLDAYSFEYTRKIKKVIMPDSVIRLGGYMQETPTSSDYDVFDGSGVEEIRISKNVSALPYGFCRNCKKLKYIEIPSNVKKIGDYAFLGTYELQTLILNEGLEKIGAYAFQSTYKLSNVSIPNSVTEIGYSAFSPSVIKNITIGSGLTEIGSYIFSNNKINSLVIPANIKKIGESAFIDNPITNLVLSNGLEEIEYNAFAGSINFEKLTIPASVKKIGSRVFSMTDSPIKNIVFENPNNWVKEGTCTPLDLSDSSRNVSILLNNDFAIIHYDNISECK